MTTLQLSRVIPVIRQEVIAERLTELRKEWQRAAGDDLDAVKASVGLLLADFAAICELDPETVKAVLGKELEEVKQ